MCMLNKDNDRQATVTAVVGNSLLNKIWVMSPMGT
jgi:hypothetical protein